MGSAISGGISGGALAAVSPYVGLRDNTYYAAPFFSLATANAAISADRIYYIPFKFEKAYAIDEIGFPVTTGAAAGKKARIGIYNDSGAGTPSTLLTNFSDVELAVDSIADLTHAISPDLSLAPGVYWFALVSDGTPTIKVTTSTNMIAAHGYTSIAVSSKYTHIVQTGFTYATLPNPVGTLTPTTGNIPMIAFKTA